MGGSTTATPAADASSNHDVQSLRRASTAERTGLRVV
jgi:hypothetical protein